jgi:hypothetical protein
MSDICDFIDQMASPALQASAFLPDDRPDLNIEQQQVTVAGLS